MCTRNVSMYFILQVKFAMLIISCDLTAREANNTIKICYDVQENFPSSSTSRNELLRLIRFATIQKTQYTAANFFSVNRKTVLGLFNVTATYFILIIQFHRIEGN